jgi:hypothetical protein
MRIFTVITSVRSEVHISQHESNSPEEAVCQHVGGLPYDDGAGPEGAELDWLQQVSSGDLKLALLKVASAEAAWMWLDGSQLSPPYVTYVVRTDISE